MDPFAPAPVCFATPNFKPGEIITMIVPGAPPIIGTYKSHDFASITLGNACTVEVGRHPQTGQTHINFAPLGVPLMQPRPERKLPLSLIMQVDVCVDEHLANGYQKAFNTIKPAKANAIAILEANKKRTPFV